MSGKLMLKRKLDDKTDLSFCNKLNAEKLSASPTPSSSSVIAEPKNGSEDNNDSSGMQPKDKRIRCDTPPPEPEDLDLPPLPSNTEHNRHLLKAIQLKMLELQNELNAFEHDIEAHEEDYYYHNDQLQNNQISEQEAEALGFAMCAQETMLFLQREGIPSDTLLYTRLRDALIGSSQSDHIFQL